MSEPNTLHEKNKESSCARILGAALILQLILSWARGAVLSLISQLLGNFRFFAYLFQSLRLALTLIVFFLPLFFYLRMTKQRLVDISAPRGKIENYRVERVGVRFNAVLFLFAAAIVLNIANLAGGATEMLYRVFGAEYPSTRLPEDYIYLALAFISSVIFAPICEELLFRGVVLKALSPYGARWAILVSGVLFALMHGSVYQLFYAFCAGCAIAFFSYAANSLSVAIGLHLANNLVSFITALVNLMCGEGAAQVFGYVLLGITAPTAVVGAVYFVKKGIWRVLNDGGGECGEPIGSQDRVSGSPICAELVIYAVFAALTCVLL